MTEVIKVDETTKKKMIAFYKSDFREKTPPYAVFQADQGDTVVTLYESGKAVFQGAHAKEDAKMWQSFTTEVSKKTIIKDELVENFNEFDIIGSDEVGTGDYFGPIVVTAALVKKDQISLINDFKIQDSKKMTDDNILNIFEK